MWRELKTHKVLFISFSITMIGSGLMGTLLALRAQSAGFSDTTVGMILASFYLGYLLSSLKAGKYIARVGHIRVFAALAALISATVLLHQIYVNAWFWMAVRFLTGIFTSGLYIIIESWLNAKSDNESRGQSMATYITIFYLSASFGQLFLFVSEPDSFVLFSIASIAISIGAIPLLITKINAPPLYEDLPTSFSIIKLYKRSPLGVIGVFACSFNTNLLTSLAPIYAIDNGFSNHQSGYFVMALNFGCVLLMMPLGKLSDRFDRRKILIMTSGICAFFAYFALFSNHGLLGILLLLLLIGGFALPMTSIANAYINDWLFSEEIIPAAATIILVSGMGAILGPILGGISIEYFGNNAYLFITALVMTSFFLFALYRITQRSVETLHEHSVVHTPIVQPSAETILQMYVERQMSFDFNYEENSKRN